MREKLVECFTPVRLQEVSSTRKQKEQEPVVEYVQDISMLPTRRRNLEVLMEYEWASMNGQDYACLTLRDGSSM